MSFGLENKVVVITGSSRGIGRALAIGFAKAGASVVINYYNSKEDAKKLLREIEKYNSKCTMIQANVTEDEEVKNFYHDVIKKYGRVDVLINNAGKNNDDYVNLMSKEKWDDVLITNLSSVFLCCRYFTKSMIKMKHGKVICIASLKGQLGSEGQSNYAATKAGVIGFSKSLAKELGPEGISVNVVCPGYITTDLNNKNINKKIIAKKMSAMSIEYGLSDLVNFVLFLSSDLLEGVSGQVFNVDSRIM